MNVGDSRSPNAWSQLVTGSIIVSALTGMAYLLVYAYDLGYCAYFRIPVSFIAISLPNLLACALVLIGIVGTVLMLIQSAGVPLSWGFRVGPVRISVAFLAFTALFWFVARIVSKASSEPTLLSGISEVLVALSYALGLTPLVVGVLFLGATPGTTEGILPRSIARFAVLVPLLATAVLCGAVTVGFYRARSQTYFPITVEKTQQVLLAIYGNEAIAASYTRCSSVLGYALTVVPLDKLPPFSVEFTGRLSYEVRQRRAHCK